MPDTVEPLILDLLEWIGQRPRPYAEVLEAWRTSCPRLPVWEEANARGFIDHVHEQGRPALVAVSALGREWSTAQRTHAHQEVTCSITSNSAPATMPRAKRSTSRPLNRSA